MFDLIMKLAYPILIFVSALAASPVYAERSLVCRSELATGFFLEEGQWEESSFSLAEFSLAFDDNFRKLMVLGKGSLGFSCSSYYNGKVTAAKDVLLCQSNYRNGDSIRYNRNTGRFLFVSSSPLGYLNGQDASESDAIYAGQCLQR